MNVNSVDSLCLSPKSLSRCKLYHLIRMSLCVTAQLWQLALWGHMTEPSVLKCRSSFNHTHLTSYSWSARKMHFINPIQSWPKVEKHSGPYRMVSMVTLWQWGSNGRMERNRQRKREVLWNLRVNGRGTLWHLKYDRPRQRRTFCNAMWLLLSVSSHWQVHWEGFLIQFPYSVTWPTQHTPMSPTRGLEVSCRTYNTLSENNPYIQIRSVRPI